MNFKQYSLISRFKQLIKDQMWYELHQLIKDPMWYECISAQHRLIENHIKIQPKVQTFAKLMKTTTELEPWIQAYRFFLAKLQKINPGLSITQFIMKVLKVPFSGKLLYTWIITLNNIVTLFVYTVANVTSKKA